VLTQGHDGAADLWAYGVVLYELMCGTTPFSGRNQQRTFEKIVHSQKHLQFQQVFDSHGKSLIRRLLHPNASLRIGCLQNGFKDIKDHAFFLTQNIDFNKLLHKDILISFIPSSTSPTASDGAADGGGIGAGGGDPWIDIQAEMRLPWNDEVENYFDGLSNSCMIDDGED
jgi:serine/threonine protein kinase